jgi:hypothetical protein
MNHWFVTIMALILAWRCNIHEPIWMRILILIIAFLYSEMYLSYYILYHWILKNPCSGSFGTHGYHV